GPFVGSRRLGGGNYIVGGHCEPRLVGAWQSFEIAPEAYLGHYEILRYAQNDKKQRARNDTLYWIASATPRNDRERKLAMTSEALASCSTTLKGRTTEFGGEEFPGYSRQIRIRS
ncbi:MAG: hypothetical protein MUP49_03905, partial [Dehalococcoidia bacterium]|nr:hypothetical protein [Dehalococcoidia bacterium]